MKQFIVIVFVALFGLTLGGKLGRYVHHYDLDHHDIHLDTYHSDLHHHHYDSLLPYYRYYSAEPASIIRHERIIEPYVPAPSVTVVRKIVDHGPHLKVVKVLKDGWGK